MTERELAELKVRINSSLAYGAPVTGWLAQGALHLIAEVERLRAENATARSMIRAGIGDGLDVRRRIADLERENAALREIAQAVAKAGNHHLGCGCGSRINERWSDLYPDRWGHRPDCIVTRARALLSKE